MPTRTTMTMTIDLLVVKDGDDVVMLFWTTD